MGKQTTEVGNYIENAGEFARPILTHLRAIMHKGCPELTESIKWSSPCFEHKGIMCHMAAFKQHCSFGFVKASLLTQNELFESITDSGMGSIAKLRSMEDLPSNELLLGWVKEAASLNERNIKPKKSVKLRAALNPPTDFASALKSSKAAQSNFQGFAAGYQRDYIDWITGAKTDATRQKRLVTAIEWIAEGKHKNWKYEGKC